MSFVNHEAEQALIASVLYKPDDLHIGLDIVPEGTMFSWSCYGHAWEAMKSLVDQGIALTIIAVADELQRGGHLEEFALPGPKIFVTGRDALSNIKDITIGKNGTESYAILVSNTYANRRMEQWFSEQGYLMQEGQQPSVTIQELEKKFGTLTLHNRAKSHTANMEAVSDEAYREICSAKAGVITFPTGLSDFDEYIAPQGGDLVVIAARPGMGKTAFLGTIMLNSAMEHNKRTKLFSAEMNRAAIGKRLLAQIADLNAYDVRRGKMKDDEMTALAAAAVTLKALPIYICDLPGITINQIRTEARRDPVDAIFVDYIQLIEADMKCERRDIEIGRVTRGLKALAKELQIPVFAAAQLSRAVEQRSEKRPVMSDLRESGDIEQDADIVIFLYNNPGKLGIIEAITAKHRNGPTASMDLKWIPTRMKFENIGATKKIDFIQIYPNNQD